MAVAEKLSELIQKRTKLHDEARELYERCEKENRPLNKDEEVRHVALCGDGASAGGEIFELDKQINQIRRFQAINRIGDDPQSGKDPETRKSSPLAHEDPANNGNGKHRFSMMKACSEILDGRGLTGIEKEVSDELFARSGIGKRGNGFKMPHRTRSLTFKDIDSQRRVLDDHGHMFDSWNFQKRALDSSAGAGSIPTILDTDWIELLRNQMQVMAAGARTINDLQGKFAIPRQSAAATAYWLAESGSPTGSNQTLDQILFVPHTIGAFTDISRRFFELTILDSGEAFVKADLSAVLARGIDLGCLNGSGSAGQILGIMQNTAITTPNTVSLGTNGALPTWAALVALHTKIARGNAASLGEFVYMGNADVEGTLATTAKIGSTYPVYLLSDTGTVYNKRILFSQQLPSNLTKGSSGATLSPIIGAIWNQMIIAYWSGLDILVDPYTGSSSGTVRIVALQDLDMQVRHNEAFAFIFDMISNQ